MNNYRLILTKKEPFQVHKKDFQKEVEEVLLLNDAQLENIYLIYDVFNCSLESFKKLKNQILIDSVTDVIVSGINFSEVKNIAIEPLPGQFDSKANAALQCLQLIDKNIESVSIKTAQVFVFSDNTSDESLEKIGNYIINPVESRAKDLSAELNFTQAIAPQKIPFIEGFIYWTEHQISAYKTEQGLAMSVADLLFIQEYFKQEENRDPKETEIKVLDTYWSDHCRHTTFLTEIKDVQFEGGSISSMIKTVYNEYLMNRFSYYGERILDKPVCLMDLATLAAKDLKKRGILTNIEESDEINACSVYTKVSTEEGEEDWLLMFKNETHNHPTEIEPFGGASTCLGGCIRDPLSGRAYVYQAMRVSGAANILEPVSETLEGKLPQKKISQEAAKGFSSYGNQIGLATTQVSEIYHEGYKAKRMEVGAVVAAAPVENVRRESPQPGDLILLLGGKTGRDGVGGATGSSKEHTKDSLETAGAEVQKGNPPEERKIQRFFRNGNVTRLIKKCNDFGAGGISVAIGELADGLDINLDVVPTKYNGLNGTELALSESQERMAVVIEAKDKEKFIAFAEQENLEATHVATVTNTHRLKMTWQGDTIVDLSRTFLDTNGVRLTAFAEIEEPEPTSNPFNNNLNEDIKFELLKRIGSLNNASQKGLAEQFDSSIGSSTVLMPFGGKYQLTPAEGSVQTFPVLGKETYTASAITWGFDADISSWSPFHGGAYAVVQSMAKLVALGANPKEAYYTFQEYFRKLGNDSKNWGLPFAALLGAYKAQQSFECGAIGGKDSMSGTFNDIHVPPTLISFAVATLDARKAISNELKSENNTNLYVLKHTTNEDYTPNFEQLNENFSFLHTLIQEKSILAASSVGKGGIATTLAKMAFGNKIGFTINTDLPLFELDYGSIILESAQNLAHENLIKIGQTTVSSNFIINEQVLDLEEVLTEWEQKLEPIFPTTTQQKGELEFSPSIKSSSRAKGLFKGRPKVFIPVFPGTNCEYDSQEAFLTAGAEIKQTVFKNNSAALIEQSIKEFTEQINSSQILMLSGGFSAGDEPDGSGKFITAVLQNEQIRTAIEQLLERDGLILGICNGFQALVKSGLLPYGEIQQKQEYFPTLTTNTIGRHISQVIETKITSTLSPWLSSYQTGDVHKIAISHGEGRFYVNNETSLELFKNGQIATQYINDKGNPTMERPYNPNGSMYAIEGITSLDGRIFGKMAHSERKGKYLYKNIPGQVGQDIFKNGVNYFK